LIFVEIFINEEHQKLKGRYSIGLS